MSKIITYSEKQTFNLGKKLAKKLQGGKVIGLIGELGAGKTVLIKGIAAGLGIKKTITSPTFVLFKLYHTDRRKCETDSHKSRIRHMAHADAYRLNSGQDLVDIGLKDWLGKPDVVTVIEWADRVKKILPKRKIIVRIKFGGEKNERVITTNL